VVEVWEIFGMTPTEWGRWWCEKMCGNRPTKPRSCGKCNFVDPNFNGDYLLKKEEK